VSAAADSRRCRWPCPRRRLPCPSPAAPAVARQAAGPAARAWPALYPVRRARAKPRALWKRKEQPAWGPRHPRGPQPVLRDASRAPPRRRRARDASRRSGQRLQPWHASAPSRGTPAARLLCRAHSRPADPSPAGAPAQASAAGRQRQSRRPPRVPYRRRRRPPRRPPRPWRLGRNSRQHRRRPSRRLRPRKSPRATAGAAPRRAA
jgi:hypothetical protein